MTISGQTTVTSAGAAVQLASDRPANSAVTVKALAANTGKVYLGNVDNDVSSANGLELAAGEGVTFEYVGNLNHLWLDAAVDGEGVCWLILSC
jgi:hypothetical protein